MARLSLFGKWPICLERKFILSENQKEKLPYLRKTEKSHMVYFSQLAESKNNNNLQRILIVWIQLVYASQVYFRFIKVPELS